MVLSSTCGIVFRALAGRSAHCSEPLACITLQPYMKHTKLLKEASRLSRPFCIEQGDKFHLKDYDPAGTNGMKSKKQAQEILQRGTELLSHMQEKLYAQDRWALLLIFQALDAAGKDGVIKHVMSGVNPQGCDVHSFKAPSNEELNHDYLRRTNACMPER